jgi:hypothetical protein
MYRRLKAENNAQPAQAALAIEDTDATQAALETARMG